LTAAGWSPPAHGRPVLVLAARNGQPPHNTDFDGLGTAVCYQNICRRGPITIWRLVTCHCAQSGHQYTLVACTRRRYERHFGSEVLDKLSVFTRAIPMAFDEASYVGGASTGGIGSGT
jgi:hypothetical protein